MARALRSDRRATIPTYELYGEIRGGLPPECMHCESIAERSKLYDWEIQPHRHEAFFQILYIEGGGGMITFENRRIPIRAPCVITVPAMSVHGFKFSKHVRGVVITVVEKHLDSIVAADTGLREVFSRPHQILLQRRSEEAGRMQQVFETMAREFGGDAPWRLAAVRAGLELALIGAARLLGDAERDRPDSVNRKMRHLQKFRALVDQSFREHKEIGYYGAQLGITPTQLNRICRSVLDKSALGVINGRLVLEAERDLIYTIMDVKSIALSLGFADTAYFSRFFAKQTGRTPTEFRQTAWRKLRHPRGWKTHSNRS